MKDRKVPMVHGSRARETTFCGAKKRQGEGMCRKPSGWGTDHVGYGRCRLHGGATPIRHGQHSKIPLRYRMRDERLQDLVADFEADPDPLSVFSEIAVLRAMLHQALDRMKEEACGTCGRPPDEKEIPGLVEGISKVTHRIERLRAMDAVSRPELFRIVQEMGLVVKYHVDEEALERITEGWMRIVSGDGRTRSMAEET